MIADQTGGFVDLVRVTALNLEIGFGADHKETANFVQSPQTLEVDVPTVHDVESTRFGNQFVEDVDLVPLAIADPNKRRDIASQIEQGVQLDRCFGRTKRCPGEYRQTQIDGGGIQSIDGLGEFDSKRFVDIEPS